MVASKASRVRGARTFSSNSESPSPRPLHAGRACPTCAPCLPNSGKPEFGGERGTNRRARSNVTALEVRERFAMKARMDFRKASPQGAKVMGDLHAYLHKSGLEQSLPEH